MEILEKIRSVATLALLEVPYEKEMKELEKEWGREELKKLYMRPVSGLS